MKNVELKFNDIWVDVEDGWLCIGDGENQILLRPEYFKKLLEAISVMQCCKSDSEQLCEHRSLQGAMCEVDYCPDCDTYIPS